jgi:DNA-binding XRE family transcriptional regulator
VPLQVRFLRHVRGPSGRGVRLGFGSARQVRSRVPRLIDGSLARNSNYYIIDKITNLSYIYRMSKSSLVASSLPPIAESALRQLGENLAIARARRKESQRAWAARIGVSVPTLIRMEKGDPTVSMGVYASALWLMGRIQALPEVAAPTQDLGALGRDIRVARRRAVRAPESVAGRLASVPGPAADADSAASRT